MTDHLHHHVGCGTSAYVVLGVFVIGMAFGYLMKPTPTLKPLNFDDESEEEEYKMILIVNETLKMGKGKIGAQCGHGAVGAVERAQKNGLSCLEYWKAEGQRKICLKAPEPVLKGIAAEAAEQGINVCTIRDAGRTQIAAGSLTVVALGPAPESVLDELTGSLKLL